MANLNEIAEVAHRQLFPNPDDETSISFEEFLSTARGEFSYQMLLFYYKQKDQEGTFELPSYLLNWADIEIKNNEADISALKIFRAFPEDLWLQNIGGIGSACQYVKESVNMAQLLVGDDSLSDNVKLYYAAGNKIYFPLGTHKNILPILYPDISGKGVNKWIEVDDAIGGIVRTRLIEIYGKAMGKEDVTNNTSSDS